MNITLILIGTPLLAILQIQVFKALPQQLRCFLSYFTIIGMLANFGLSHIILHFAGLAYGIGLINLFSSVVFGFYISWYKRHYDIQLKMKRIFPQFTMKRGEKR